MKNLLRYGTHGEQKFFLKEFEDFYECIVINANMIAFSPDALSLFVAKKTVNKPFFIDPQTHAFQHDLSYILDSSWKKIKKSILNLMDKYWDIKEKMWIKIEWDELVSWQPIKIDAFNDKSFLSDFVEKVINYQKDFITSSKSKEYNEYIDFLSENNFWNSLEIKITPEFFVAPYFYIDENVEWLDLNIELLKKAKELFKDKKIFWQIVMSKNLILEAISDYETSKLKEIADKYCSIDIDWYLIWIDGYSEHEELSNSLEVFADFVKNIKETTKKTIYNLYWSFFSQILTHSELWYLDGVCTWMEYWEYREVIPVWWWLPQPKFYLFDTHSRIKANDMIFLLKELNINSKKLFYEKVCWWKRCKENINSDNIIEEFHKKYWDTKLSTVNRRWVPVVMSYSTKETKENSLKHYLYTKEKEFDYIKNENLNKIILDLEQNYDKYKNCLDIQKIRHLKSRAKTLIYLLSTKDPQ